MAVSGDRWERSQAAELHGMRAELALSHVGACGDVMLVGDCVCERALAVGGGGGDGGGEALFVGEVASAAAVRSGQESEPSLSSCLNLYNSI